MVSIEKIDTTSKAQVRRFVRFPFSLYSPADGPHPMWVPPLFVDAEAYLDRRKHPFFGLLDLLLEMRRTSWVSLNGAGILPEFQGRGGNALLYSEMEKTILEYNFKHADLTQVGETALQMRKDLENLGAFLTKTTGYTLSRSDRPAYGS